MYAFSKHKPGTAYHAVLMEHLAHLKKHGRLPDGCKAEMFIDGVRVEGSVRWGEELPDGLADADGPMFVFGPAEDEARFIMFRDGVCHTLHAPCFKSSRAK